MFGSVAFAVDHGGMMDDGMMYHYGAGRAPMHMMHGHGMMSDGMMMQPMMMNDRMMMGGYMMHMCPSAMNMDMMMGKYPMMMNMNDKQKMACMQAMKEYQMKMQPLCMEMWSKNIELKALMNADKPDMKKINATTKAMKDMYMQMMAARQMMMDKMSKQSMMGMK